MRWLGIDFSGDHRMWRPGLRFSNIWIADVRMESRGLVLSSLEPVQHLLGDEAPFDRLRNLLRGKEFDAAGIDAPFSIPSDYLPPGGQRELLEVASKVKRPKDRPFPTANDFVCQVLKGHALRNKKPLRKTESYWKSKGINVRSTLWTGPRGGAAMTSACLILLCEAGCPIWPWDDLAERGLLVEAFPAAQLCHWGLPYHGYNGDSSDALLRRRVLTDFLSKRIFLSWHRAKTEKSADALDAVLCSFAAIAATTRNLVRDQENWPRDEGLIVVNNKSTELV